MSSNATDTTKWQRRTPAEPLEASPYTHVRTIWKSEQRLKPQRQVSSYKQPFMCSASYSTYCLQNQKMERIWNLQCSRCKRCFTLTDLWLKFMSMLINTFIQHHSLNKSQVTSANAKSRISNKLQASEVKAQFKFHISKCNMQ